LESAAVLKVSAATCGVVLLVLVWLSVLRTTLIPRRTSSRIARWTAVGTAALVTRFAGRLPVRLRDAAMEFCAPVSLLVMVVGWLAGLTIGFGLLGLAFGVAFDPNELARFFTLDMGGGPGAIAILGAGSALFVLILCGVYLGQLVDAYHRRERMIIRSASRVRVVTDADKLLADHLRTGSRDSLDTFFARWADWLADIYQSHSSYPALVFHRSAGRLCWAKAALIVMDAAALVEAVAPTWAPLHTRVLLDVGSSCLQHLARHIGIVIPMMTVSLQGREERAFGDTMRLATDSGLPAERDLNCARAEFQEIRVRYAPYAVLIGARLSPWNNGEIV
jgi:hypothetical protein